MAQSYEFYCDRADAAATAAENATLDNVRDRELRAEKTWRGLAAQARQVAVDREKRSDERAAKLAEQAEAEQAQAEQAQAEQAELEQAEVEQAEAEQ